MKFEENLACLFELTAAIQDPQIKSAFVTLFNIIEELDSRNKVLVEENQRLRDEVNRLKGEQGKPDIKPNNRTASVNILQKKKEIKRKSGKKILKNLRFL